MYKTLKATFSNKQLLGLIVFLLGFATAFWGSFEMAYQSGNHPIWSGTWGFPIVHHYVVGFIMILVGVTMLTYDKYLVKLIYHQ